MVKIRLYCLPYAGGSASMYKKWKSFLDPSIELVPLELSGRGTKSCHPLYKDIGEAVREIAAEVSAPHLPYSIFGHSFGAILSLLLTAHLEISSYPPPKMLFISGAAPLHTYNKKEKIGELPDISFIQKIEEIGGMPEEFLEEPELKNLLLPVIRQDFRLLEGYNFPYPPPEISPPLYILQGQYDEFTKGDIFDWHDYTNGEVSVHTFNGDHFFINSCQQELISLINRTCC